MRLCFAAMVIAGCVGGLLNAQQVQPGTKATGLPVNDPVLERVLREWPDGRISTVGHPGEWAYEQGVLLDGVTALWRVTGVVCRRALALLALTSGRSTVTPWRRASSTRDCGE